MGGTFSKQVRTFIFQEKRRQLKISIGNFFGLSTLKAASFDYVAHPQLVFGRKQASETKKYSKLLLVFGLWQKKEERGHKGGGKLGKRCRYGVGENRGWGKRRQAKKYAGWGRRNGSLFKGGTHICVCERKRTEEIGGWG